MQSGQFLGEILGPSPKTGLRLTKNVHTSPAKRVVIQLRIKVAEPAADMRIHEKMIKSATTTNNGNNKKTEGFMRVVRSVEDFINKIL